jgi:hypothetical protein
MSGMMQQACKEPLYKSQPELSLGPSLSLSTLERCGRIYSSDSDGITSRKRRKQADAPDNLVELQLGRDEPLPLHWEQCLDLDVSLSSLIKMHILHIYFYI